jgi:hypothetical protein
MSYHEPDNLVADTDSDETCSYTAWEIRGRLRRNYVEAARRRVQRLEYFTPTGPESSDQMGVRLTRVKNAGIARMSRCADTRRVSVAWIEPALGNFEGMAASGLILLREDVDLRAGTSSGVYPFGAISKHALRRFVMRSDVDSLDEVMVAAASGLGWNHVAVELDVEGEYLVPHANGIFCNLALRRGLRDLSDPSGKIHPVTLMKTWFARDGLREPLASIRERLLRTTRSKTPFFPGFNEIHDWHIPAFREMREEGRERERIRLSGYGRPNDDKYAFWRPAESSDVEMGKLEP